MTDERRAALEAAFNEHQEADKKIEEPAPTPELEVKLEAPEPEIKVDEQKVELEAATRPDLKKPAPVIPDKKVEAPPAVAAPNSWKPAEREHWAKIPAEAQAAIQRREQEVQKTLSQSAGARKFQDEFVNTIKPFSHLIRAQNSTPIQAVQNLMTTAAGLTVGNAEQKAKIVCEIIENYGVDIATLDAVLSKQPVPSGQPKGALPAEFAQMLQPVYGFMDEIKQAREQHQQQVTEKAQEEVAKFNPPFLDDVANDMADLMDYAASKNQTMSLQQAYDIAVNLKPDIKKLIDQKKAAAVVAGNSQDLARKRRAASSVQGAPIGGGAPAAPANRRDALVAAWDGAGR